MLEMQLYIKGQRVDTFKDESVTLTDSIQNVRDFEKVFTSFSQSFNLPASKTNNKILKHYYNFNIEADYAFDARIKTTAFIELNSLPFRRGFIKLEGVDLKDNIPYSYRVTFFGEIVKIKDAIGESKLSDLIGLGDTDYSSSNIITMLQRDASQGFDEVVPLITHTQRLFYDSGSSTHGSGNLAPGGNKHGVKWNELKPAMRVNKIIEAIENTFPQLEFTNDFFKNTNNPKFNNLFMWLSRKSGAVENLSGEFETETSIQFPAGTSPGGIFISSGGILSLSTSASFQNVLTWQYNFFKTSGGSYKVQIRSFGNTLVYDSGIQNGNLQINKSDLNILPNQQIIFLLATVITTATVNFSNITWLGEYQAIGSFDIYNRNTGSLVTGTEFNFDYAKQMPDITIINFLSGLFKLFNLTAFVQDDGKIKVQPLNEYYNENPTTRDITEFVGIDKSSVDAALPYRQVKFEFSDTKSFLANKFGEIENKAWGLIAYNNSQNDLTGSLYKVTAPFGHFLYERLNDANNGNQLDIQWGFSVDKSQNAMLPQPLLFYPIYPGNDTQQISIVDEVDENNEPVSDTTRVPKAMPFNHYALDPANGNFQLNFAQEISEWTGLQNFTETLFTAYEKYIVGVFNPKQRMTKVEVMLPLAVLLSIQMKDRIVIAGHNYIINKLTTNLSTGKSQLELLNDYNIEA
tara:strand:- start:1023 stop:3086 length:2064 start_codon:yes stop_codon:yes gene_type:complete